MSVHAGYDPIGTKCVGKSQPGTVCLADAVQDRWGGRSLGIYVCRSQRGRTNLSAHGEGRAYDHQWFDRDAGFVIANRLIEKHAELGIQVVIWWEKIWSYERRDEGWRDYQGEDDHKTHLHIEQNWSGAHDLTYAAAMNALLTPPPYPAPIHEENDMLIYTVEGKGTFLFTGNAVVGLDQNALNELKRAGVRYAGNMNSAFHNWAVDTAAGKNNAGKVA